MGKKVQQQKPKKQFKLGDEIIDGTDTLYGALQKKFGIDKTQAVGLQPYVSMSSNYTPGQIPYSGFNKPVGNPDVFLKPVESESQYIKPGSYAVIDAVKRANDIYAPVGGFKAVMDAKRANPNFGEYDKLAKEYYNTSANTAGSIETKPYENTVKKYNDFMSNKKSSYNIPIVNEKISDDYAGVYDPVSKKVGIVQPPILKRKDSGDSLYYPTGVIGHELTHSLQDKLNKKSYKLKDTSEEVYSNIYNSIPEEIHARATQLNQDYSNRTKGKLADEATLDAYVSKYINNYDRLNAIREGYIQMLEDSNVDPWHSRLAPLMEQNEEYKQLMGDTPYMEYRVMNDMMTGTENNGNRLIMSKDGKVDKAKAAKYLKALIMTTAKNNEQIPQQPNGVFDNGFNIS